MTFSRQKALDCAVEFFWRDGFEATDIASIARAIGMTKPSLYRHFGDKAELFRQALRHYQTSIGQAPLAAFLAEGDVAVATRAFLSTAIDKATEGGKAKGCFLACAAGGESGGEAEAMRIYGAALNSAEDVLNAGFRRHRRAAGVRHDFPCAARARLAVDLAQANALRARIGTGRERLLAGVAEQVALILA